MAEPLPEMDSIFAWTEIDPAGGEGVIVASLPFLRNMLGPLQHRRRDMAERMRPIAELHRRRTGHKVRLVRFVRAETVEELGG
jgi:hypothetical protein